MSLLKSQDTVCKYLSYQYRAADGRTQFMRLPMVHAILESRVEKIATDALVDTGSTTTLVPKGIADAISLLSGVQNPVHQEATGAGGRFPTTRVKLKRLTLVKNVTPFCRLVEVEVLVPDEEERLPYVILGRDHVFKHFDITFQENRRKFASIECRQ